jgi:hypothetical protein
MKTVRNGGIVDPNDPPSLLRFQLAGVRELEVIITPNV